MRKLTQIYIGEIVRLHGVPSNILSNREPRFWQTLQEALGTKLRLSSAYHPQTDGQSKRTIPSLEDLLKIYVLDHLGSWDEMSSLTITITKLSYEWLLSRHYMEESAGHLCSGFRMVRVC